MAQKLILFVCTGNTCRSPMAEALFREAVKEASDEYLVCSAGVSAWPGQPASRETQAILKKRGIRLDHASMAVDPELVEDADYIFTMTSGHRDILLSLFPEAEEKVFLAGEFAQLGGRYGADIPDPFGMGAPAYEKVAQALDQVIPTLVGHIEQSSKES